MAVLKGWETEMMRAAISRQRGQFSLSSISDWLSVCLTGWGRQSDCFTGRPTGWLTISLTSYTVMIISSQSFQHQLWLWHRHWSEIKWWQVSNILDVEHRAYLVLSVLCELASLTHCSHPLMRALTAFWEQFQEVCLPAQNVDAH